MKENLSRLLVLGASYIARIHRIEKGNFVTWDEAHFGKFSQKYLSRLFYFDVHPPLGKMLTALSGFIHGQTSAFDFGSAAEYPIKFDYVGMRRFHALVASFTPLFAFLILREFKFSLRRSLLLSLLFILENGVIAISRLILLDSHLMTFTAATAYVFTLLFTRTQLLRRGKEQAGDTRLLCALGVCIGCVMSIKWIGCLTTLQVGLFIIFDLFRRIQTMDLRGFLRYFGKRTLCLIAIPCSIYVGMFYLHFTIVNRSGPDDGFMSSEFQLSLKGNLYKDLKKYVSYGNQITLRTHSGYLHSHFHSYPDYTDPETGKTGTAMSREELQASPKAPLQATTYAHSDSNNNFYFQKISEEGMAEFVCDGDAVALLHNETKGYLQQSGEGAYMTDGSKVFVNRQEGLDPAAVWIVEIERDTVKKEPRLKAVSSKFYLRNRETGMFLCASAMKYPTWGFNQGEITCVKAKEKNCLFNLQENFFSNAPGNVLYTELRPSFLSRFLEHQGVMLRVNGSFVTDPDLAPEGIVSRPMDWIFLRKGIRMSQWHEQFKFYMFFNPLIHYTATLCLLTTPVVVYLRYVMRRRRETARAQARLTAEIRLKDVNGLEAEETCAPRPAKASAGIQSDVFFLYLSVGGWLLHFLPFFIVGRVLYLHHYFPALFFATLNICFLLRNRSFLTCCVFVGLCALVFAMYAPLNYGFLDQQKMARVKLFSSWNFSDK